VVLLADAELVVLDFEVLAIAVKYSIPKSNEKTLLLIFIVIIIIIKNLKWVKIRMEVLLKIVSSEIRWNKCEESKSLRIKKRSRR
jgi:hypothetical protein